MQTIPRKKQKKHLHNFIRILMLVTAFLVLWQLPNIAFAKSDSKVYRDGIYCYIITSEEHKKVQLIGLEQEEAMQEFVIPGTASINGTNYQVSAFSLQYEYYANETYSAFYNSVTKLVIADDFTGTLQDPIDAFAGVRTIEFKGMIPPKNVNVELTNGCINPDVLFIVPEGTEEAYKSVIHELMLYSSLSVLYEHGIDMTPTIVSDTSEKIEDGCFIYDNLIFIVTDSAKDGTGSIKLVGLTKMLVNSYLSLPEEVTNDGYTYKLTKLCTYSLVACGARAIIIPDTVEEMEPAIFDYRVELLFLSKNCKTIPKRMITDENNVSHLRFVYVPEGVTTILENAFNNDMTNKGSIILPNTIQALGKKSLYSFELITFLNKKPISNLNTSIKTGVTVKVNSSAVKKYKNALNSKITVIDAKKVVKSNKLTIADTNLEINIKDTIKEKASLSKSSNETIFWLTTDSDIVEVSTSGLITAKRAGTAYVIAYTRTSGLHKAVLVTVLAN